MMKPFNIQNSLKHAPFLSAGLSVLPHLRPRATLAYGMENDDGTLPDDDVNGVALPLTRCLLPALVVVVVGTACVAPLAVALAGLFPFLSVDQHTFQSRPMSSSSTCFS
jgi:hypothetical protein